VTQQPPQLAAVTTADPFRFALFRVMFGALSLNNMVIWLHMVAAGLLMASLTPLPLMTALVQAAITFPAFLFSAHAGAVSDLVDRRRMILVTQAGMVLSTAAVLLLALSGLLGPQVLLLLTFLLGTAFALGMPAWITAAPDAVPPAYRLQAVGLNTVSYNAARAVGPALAGGVIALAGVQAVFATTLLASLAVLLLVWRQCPAAPPSAAATEPVGAALRAGFRYARHAPFLHACFGRTVTFVLGGSALWALLPLVAQRTGGSPTATAAAYAWMLGSMGAGAVVAGLCLDQLRRLTTLPRLVTAAAFVFGATTALTAAVESLWVVVPALFLAGAGWVSSSATIMAAIQTSLPMWVRARVLALQMLLFQGAMAAGSMLWGTIANLAGVPLTLLLSALLICTAQVFTARWPLRLGVEAEMEPAALPEVPVAWAPPREEGPVAVEIEYWVDTADEAPFIRQAYRIGRSRMRNGARFWRLYRDLDDRSRLLERFVVDSWDEYLRQRDRSTVADQAAEQALLAHVRPGTEVRTRHFVDQPLPARDAGPLTPKGDTPCDSPGDAS